MKSKSFRRIAALFTTVVLVVAAANTLATAQTYTDLYDFGSNSGDPNDPQWSGVIAEGPDGNLYSTTNQHWTGGLGDVYSIGPTGTLTVLHNFNGTDGQAPVGGLTLATDGNFYGTTWWGGEFGNGTIFKITAGGSLTTMYSFTGGADGGGPSAPPIQGSDGNFYGITTAGGDANDGTVYKITPTGAFTTLHSFDGTDGSYPSAPLMQATDGNFYGTTLTGGTNSDGTIFRIGSSGTFDVLYNFVGSGSYAPLIQGSDGNFYGTESGNFSASSGGAVFQITPSGEFTVLYTFTGGSDGQNPVAGLVQATDGNFYGTNDLGGANGWGVLFRISSTGAFATLYAFGAGTAGASPQATLLQHTNGLLYGDTAVGGAFNEGQFYSFNVGLGGGPIAGLSPNALTFAAQALGTTSPAQIVTLTNIGGKSLNLTQIAASGDFAETNTCNTSLAVGSSCQISVTFTPTASGSRAGSITIKDNAAGKGQTVPLSGIGFTPDFSIGAAAGASTSQTISAGQNATFNLVITPNGFSGTVNLSCSIAPAVTPAPSCNLPSSVQVTAGEAAPVIVNVNTTPAVTGGTITGFKFPTGTLPMAVTLVLASGLLLAWKRRRLPALVVPVVLALISLAGCGGSSSASSHTTPGTPAGTYTATIKATSGSLNHGTTLTVVVQ